MHCTLRTLREDLQGGHRWGRARRWGGLEAVCRAVSAAPALRSAVRLCRAGCPSVTAVAGIPVGIRSTYSAESPSPSRHVISQRARERERARERGREREGERERAHRQCLAQLCCAMPLACAVSLCRLKLTLPDRLGSSYTRPYVCVFLHSQCTVHSARCCYGAPYGGRAWWIRSMAVLCCTYLPVLTCVSNRTRFFTTTTGISRP